jgi:hypothetical protein
LTGSIYADKGKGFIKTVLEIEIKEISLKNSRRMRELASSEQIEGTTERLSEDSGPIFIYGAAADTGIDGRVIMLLAILNQFSRSKADPFKLSVHCAMSSEDITRITLGTLSHTLSQYILNSFSLNFLPPASPH